MQHWWPSYPIGDRASWRFVLRNGHVANGLTRQPVKRRRFSSVLRKRGPAGVPVTSCRGLSGGLPGALPGLGAFGDAGSRIPPHQAMAQLGASWVLCIYLGLSFGKDGLFYFKRKAISPQLLASKRPNGEARQNPQLLVRFESGGRWLAFNGGH